MKGKQDSHMIDSYKLIDAFEPPSVSELQMKPVLCSRSKFYSKSGLTNVYYNFQQISQRHIASVKRLLFRFFAIFILFSAPDNKLI